MTDSIALPAKRVVQVRDLPADRQADASRHYETPRARAASEA